MRSGFFPKLGFFAGFSLYIINFAGRISEAAMGGAGARSALFCALMSLKHWWAQCTGAHALPKPTM
jgi:hypothetical protein